MELHDGVHVYFVHKQIVYGSIDTSTMIHSLISVGYRKNIEICDFTPQKQYNKYEMWTVQLELVR